MQRDYQSAVNKQFVVNNSAVNPFKWLFLTALLLTLGFALTVQVAHYKFHPEDNVKLLMVELQEADADAESVSQFDDTPVVLNSAFDLQFDGNASYHHLSYSEFAPRLTFLYHIRPRSPPSLQTS